ncbi:MAG TPA: hypothetical protein VF839_08475 [Clostridium sp.]
MGKLIKITMYAERKKCKGNEINISILEENFATYEKWLEKTNREDGIENYKKFLMIV